MKKRPTSKPKKRKIKTVKLTPDTIIKVQPAKGVVPLMATDPVEGVVILPVEAAKIKERSWFDRMFR